MEKLQSVFEAQKEPCMSRLLKPNRQTPTTGYFSGKPPACSKLDHPVACVLGFRFPK